MAKVLIIDDDKIICETLSSLIRRMGYDATYALTLKNGLKEASSEAFDVVFLDIRMPDGNGLHVLPRIRQTPSSPEVIIMTAYGDPEGVELAIKSGAWDYIQKPFSTESIAQQLVSSLRYRKERKVIKAPGALKLEGIVGNSPQMRICYDLIAQAANSRANVLITGETGAGKEIIAQAIHANSRYAKRSFVVVDCAALPQTLVESVLFGHEKGAFTGADRPQEGLIKQADGGTLFLDEVGELPLSIQKTFFRVLQERRFRPVGGKSEIESNFMLVAATNLDLKKMVHYGRFRKELLFRLRAIAIELPPLRERKEDIKELFFYYMAKLCERYGMGKKSFAPEFFETLIAYAWPGNVRELINTLDSTLAAAQDDPILFCKHLPTEIRIKMAQVSVGQLVSGKDSPKESAKSSSSLPKLQDFRQAAIAKAESQYLHNLMSLTRGSIKEACQISGLGRTRLYILMKKYKISRLGWPSSDTSS